MINVKTIENTVMVEKPCDGRDGANFALKVTSCTNTSVVCQESFRNPGDMGIREFVKTVEITIFFLIPILFFLILISEEIAAFLAALWLNIFF